MKLLYVASPGWSWWCHSASCYLLLLPSRKESFVLCQSCFDVVTVCLFVCLLFRCDVIKATGACSITSCCHPCHGDTQPVDMNQLQVCESSLPYFWEETLNLMAVVQTLALHVHYNVVSQDYPPSLQALDTDSPQCCVDTIHLRLYTVSSSFCTKLCFSLHLSMLLWCSEIVISIGLRNTSTSTPREWCSWRYRNCNFQCLLHIWCMADPRLPRMWCRVTWLEWLAARETILCAEGYTSWHSFT